MWAIVFSRDSESRAGPPAKITETMADFLILLLSTDWFLPYWIEIGIVFPENKKIIIQTGCRQIVEGLLGGADSFYLVSFSEERKKVTRERFLALLRQWETEAEMSVALGERENLSHKELTAVVACAMLNAEISSADGSGNAPDLEFAIRAEVVKSWEAHRLKASVFREICLSSKTSWDIRTQKLLSSPRTLVNQLWRVLLHHRFRAFWRELQNRLSSKQLQELVSWYRAMVKAKAQEDRPDLIPSYIR